MKTNFLNIISSGVCKKIGKLCIENKGQVIFHATQFHASEYGEATINGFKHIYNADFAHGKATGHGVLH